MANIYSWFTYLRMMIFHRHVNVYQRVTRGLAHDIKKKTPYHHGRLTTEMYSLKTVRNQHFKLGTYLIEVLTVNHPLLCDLQILQLSE